MSTGETATGVALLKIAGYGAGIVISEYIGIPTEQISILAMLMLIDFITGVLKQYRIDPQGITSNQTFWGLMRKMSTVAGVMSVGLALKGNGIEAIYYIRTILGIIVTAELYSILQNIYTIRTGVKLKEFDAVSLMIKGGLLTIKERVIKGFHAFITNK